MKFLCVNAGSSSLKFQLFEMPEEKLNKRLEKRPFFLYNVFEVERI